MFAVVKLQYVQYSTPGWQHSDCLRVFQYRHRGQVGKECGKECLRATNDGINHLRAWVKLIVGDYLVLGYHIYAC